jgi:hypothetical protein
MSLISTSVSQNAMTSVESRTELHMACVVGEAIPAAMKSFSHEWPIQKRQMIMVAHLLYVVQYAFVYCMGSLRSTVAAPHSFYRYQYRYGIVVVVVRGRGWNSDTHILFSFTVIRC